MAVVDGPHKRLIIPKIRDFVEGVWQSPRLEISVPGEPSQVEGHMHSISCKFQHIVEGKMEIHE